MEKEEAMALIGENIQPNGNLLDVEGYAIYSKGNTYAFLDGEFTSEHLQAIAWYMKQCEKEE